MQNERIGFKCHYDVRQAVWGNLRKEMREKELLMVDMFFLPACYGGLWCMMENTINMRMINRACEDEQ